MNGSTPRWVADELGITGTVEAEAATPPPRERQPPSRLRCGCGHADETHRSVYPYRCTVETCACARFRLATA